jgi:hypothetical protein
LIRLTKLSVRSLLLGLMALGGATAAHATQCTATGGSSLEDSLFSQFGSNQEGGCGVDLSKPGEQGSEEEGGPKDGGPHFFPPPQDGWHDGWHDGKYYKDGKECSPPVVPLPPSSLLLASGVVALLALGRRRRLATA